MQHPALRVGEIEAAAGPGDRDVCEPALLFDAVVLRERVLVREDPFLEPAHEYGVKFESLCGMHGHQLERRTPFGSLRLAGFECGVREKRGKRIPGFLFRLARDLER